MKEMANAILGVGVVWAIVWGLSQCAIYEGKEHHWQIHRLDCAMCHNQEGQ